MVHSVSRWHFATPEHRALEKWPSNGRLSGADGDAIMGAMAQAADPAIDPMLRALAPQVLGAVVRHRGHFDLAEDAVQEALAAAAAQWPAEGIPENPRGWLIRVASRRLIDALRSEEARRRREETAATSVAPDSAVVAPADDDAGTADRDDTLTLLFLCCHPSLTPSSQIALTLRAVGGLTTGEIASAFLVPEPTMGQRISRAKAKIKQSGVGFEMPAAEELSARLAVVLHVLYLIFNEGYTASEGTSLQRADLTGEAIRLARLVHDRLPDDGEVAGLLALMLLTDARSRARTDVNGDLVPLAEQDRALWDAQLIEEGVALVTDAMRRRELGPYQVQAAIAAVHDEAARAEDTDWRQIVALYGVLARVADNPMVTLNQAVATAMVDGPEAGLAMLEPLDDDPRIADHHRLTAVRAHLRELAGDRARAVEQYRLAAQRTTSAPERRYLLRRAADLDTGSR
jgi:RNA polymerase sigma factor (sigma-70 family)